MLHNGRAEHSARGIALTTMHARADSRGGSMAPRLGTPSEPLEPADQHPRRKHLSICGACEPPWSVNVASAGFRCWACLGAGSRLSRNTCTVTLTARLIVTDCRLVMLGVGSGPQPWLRSWGCLSRSTPCVWGVSCTEGRCSPLALVLCVASHSLS